MPRIALPDPNVYLRYVDEENRNAVQPPSDFTNYSHPIAYLERLSDTDRLKMAAVHEAISDFHHNLIEHDRLMRKKMEKLLGVLQQFQSAVQSKLNGLDDISQKTSLCTLMAKHADLKKRTSINVYESWDDLHTYFLGEKSYEKPRSDILVIKKARTGRNKNSEKRSNTYGDCFKGLFNIYWGREHPNKIWLENNQFISFMTTLAELQDEFETSEKIYKRLPSISVQAIEAYAQATIGAQSFEKAEEQIEEARDAILDLD
ncbi:uncharacterized protein LOC129598644 [Paramacrobiotus metropolitanus]|uniref:uncharacterized protein LOC129598644 n=1 Tax=Paramacrobiotus metropolitanus TaxID=2943436 RepID=UPI002445D77C|nr:uncharacterized protein LOC129598644 [Paramacrobiotus metropolitanus]